MDSINNSSASMTSLEDLILSDTITLTNNMSMTDTMSSATTVTIDLNNVGAVGAAAPTYIYSSSGSDTITLGNIDFVNSWTSDETIPFEDGFPAWDDFQNMCKEYPGLDKTFEHLKAFYKLCKDDWEAKKRGDAE